MTSLVPPCKNDTSGGLNDTPKQRSVGQQHSTTKAVGLHALPTGLPAALNYTPVPQGRAGGEVVETAPIRPASRTS